MDVMDDQQGKRDVVGMIGRLVELAMPNLRHYYRMTKKAKIVAVYPSNGEYFADVQPLRNDESVDPSEPVVPHGYCSRRHRVFPQPVVSLLV